MNRRILLYIITIKMSQTEYDTVNEDEFSEWLPNHDSTLIIEEQDDEP